MDKLKLAVENYIFAKKMLRRAAAKLDELGVSVPVEKIEIHVCVTKYENWASLKEALGVEKTETILRNCDRFPASEQFEYNGANVFRLLGGGD